MIRLKEIAEDCGVNVSTVSRALNDDPRVKSDTRKKIHAAASRMGYTTNWAAQSLKGAKTNTIWLVIADLFNPLTAQLATYCSHELAKAGFDLSVILYHNSQLRYEHLLRRLLFGITDGALIIGSRNFNSFKKRGELIDDLRQRSLPTIFLDRFERERHSCQSLPQTILQRFQHFLKISSSNPLIWLWICFVRMKTWLNILAIKPF